MPEQPGTVTVFGSGETSTSGRSVFDWLMRRLPVPVQVAILETPAGFQPNSELVVGTIGEFLLHRLQNYQPRVQLIPARKLGTPYSPDEPQVVGPLRTADLIFMGPGSPSYAVRQLRDSLAWQTLEVLQRLGTALVLSSSAAVAASKYALPVYEIYKVGEDLHWKAGLDFFAAYGLQLVIVPHWNNAEGGADFDTSRCWMGESRFLELHTMLPPEVVVIGVDEHTALVFDLPAETCRVMGKGSVTLLRCGEELRFQHGQAFSVRQLGQFRPAQLQEGIPQKVWEWMVEGKEPLTGEGKPSAEVLSLIEQRQSARLRRDWADADALRERITRLGWQVSDTPQGPRLEHTIGQET